MEAVYTVTHMLKSHCECHESIFIGKKRIMVTRERKVCEKSYVVNEGLLSSSMEATADSEEGAPSDTAQSQVQLYRKFYSTSSFLR